MRKLRALTRKPVVCAPLWPNAGVQVWYEQRLNELINETERELMRALAPAWRDTPPLFATDEYNGAVEAAGVMFRCGELILLMHRTDGQGWAFPGGTVEPNETAEAAARREAFEETLHPCNGLLELIDCRKTNGVKFATFVTEVLESFTPTLNSEHDGFAWFRLNDQFKKGELHPGVCTTLHAIRAPSLAQDAPSGTKALQALLAKWGAQSIKRFDLASQTLAEGFANRSMMATQAGMASQLKAAGFTVAFRPTMKSLEAYRAVAAENVALIKSIPRKWHEQIEQKVWNAVRNGSDLSKLSIELRNTYGSTVKRAALIARDQNAKAKAVIERVRQQELGITRGIWMHSHAGKEPRPTHVKMNNEPYDLNRGLWDSDEGEYVHPGELINCRCSMRPVIDGAEDYADYDDGQPTNVALGGALRNAERNKGKSHAAEMRNELRMLRDARSTWFGREEMQLRTDIDEFLRNEG